ncbi:glycosyltransferase family 2 protein [Paenibacillus filicis]|uniref:Glycosyltransferase family 2 protein n=1 Tax=Paenibacillus gyeongsangnamensis TaxID=3388067 RepID=A0ABT4Q9T2_9BACL|nr:glycosyltransferase family 2 protein [Paenibacillus filicis]MCZ8513584.1 glycosyltransferase family 2 protein [Paenibacillus filicis]
MQSQNTFAVKRHGTKVSVIIPVMNERGTLPDIIREVKKLKPANPEIIVVVNGSTDGSKEAAQSMGVKVIHFKSPLGHDVGRSVGARHATGDILLFMDGDMVIPAHELQSFIRAVRRGVDVALNRYLGKVTESQVHPVVLAKHALNVVLGRPDLHGASMTTVPHAISRKALSIIGPEHLAVPPIAHAAAILEGLRVEAVHMVNVGQLNRFRVRKPGRLGTHQLRNLIIGDHVEAIHWLTQKTDDRARYTDLWRNRNAVR